MLPDERKGGLGEVKGVVPRFPIIVQPYNNAKDTEIKRTRVGEG